MDEHKKLSIKVKILGGVARIQGDNPPVITEWKSETPQPTQAEFDAITDEQVEQWLDTRHRDAWEQARARLNTYTPRERTR